MEIKPLGDHAMILNVGDTISKVSHGRVMNFLQAFTELKIHGVEDLIPAYSSLTIIYDPFLTSYQKLATIINEIEVTDDFESNTLVRLPICYDAMMAPDLEMIGQTNGMTKDEVVNLHLLQVYQVYMMGFLPGFLYMGEVDIKIQVPRRSIPRKAVATGSVGIADNQTGIYPISSPGGWNIVGRCPVQLFNPKTQPMFQIEIGEQVQFFEINRREFDMISGNKSYQIERRHVD